MLSRGELGIPWKLDPHSNQYLLDCYGVVVVDVDLERHREAVMKIMNCHHDLVEACKRLLERIDGKTFSYTCIREETDAIRAALAKARA